MTRMWVIISGISGIRADGEMLGKGQSCLHDTNTMFYIDSVLVVLGVWKKIPLFFSSG